MPESGYNNTNIVFFKSIVLDRTVNFYMLIVTWKLME